MSSTTATGIVERIWARDATLWTGARRGDVARLARRAGADAGQVDSLLELAATADYDHVVLLGMGGSSLAPEVLRRAFGAGAFDVLDTTHPAAIRRLADSLDLARTLFVVSLEVGRHGRDALAPRLLLGAAWR